MRKLVLSAALFFITYISFCQQKPLFKIIENGKTGYIDKEGKIIIAPTFMESSEFSEGMAVFRKGGYYGYINTKGKIIIAPKYEFAESFQFGIANVFINGKQIFINKQEEKILPQNFKTIRFIDKNTIVYTTEDNRSGLYDLTSKTFITKPKNHEFRSFNKGLAIVTKKQNSNYKYGVINKNGNFIVNFGKYSKIDNYHHGYALVEMYASNDKEESFEGVIDQKGKLLFKRSTKNHFYIDGDFNNGLAAVYLYKYWIPEKRRNSYSSTKSYQGYINLKGETVFNDTLTEYVKDFSNNRAIIQDKDRNYYVLDTKFNKLNKIAFSRVKGDKFENGYAIVETKDGWGIIDTTMTYLVKPEYDIISKVDTKNKLFVYGVYGNKYKKLFGIKDFNGNHIVSPIIEELDEIGFQNGILKTIINQRLTFINLAGDIIWQNKIPQSKTAANSTNITYMNRAYFYAYSEESENSYSGGWAVSKNRPKKLPSSLRTNKLELIRENDKLFIRNSLQDTIEFEAQDSRLYMKLQAKNQNGQWQDIEYTPSSWCGNSYHSIELPPNTYWEFDAINYIGVFKTSLRAELKYIDPDTEKEKTIYSNEFEGSVNPGQFWRRPSYIPGGLMDPYNE